jgi:uncharacterized lipoprotein YddW (UPF0748 family)
MKKLSLIALSWLFCLNLAAQDKFKAWVWLSGGKEKTEKEWLKELSYYKRIGIDALLLGAHEDVLRTVAPLAKQLKMELHAWQWTTNQPNDSIALLHPNWYMVNALGQSCHDSRPYVEYYQWLCPSVPEARKHIYDKMERIAKIDGIESVHLDYVRFPDVELPIGLWPKYGIEQDTIYPQWDYCYCGKCRSDFKALHGVDPLELKTAKQHQEWLNFRHNLISNFVSELRDMAHSHNKQITAAVFPHPTMAANMVRQNWSGWKLDAALPMLYHNFYNEPVEWIGKITKVAIAETNPKIPIHAGIFLPDCKAGDIKKIIHDIKNAGGKGVAFFSANSITKEKGRAIKKVLKTIK